MSDDSPYRILIADDEETISRSTSELLRKEGWDCKAVKNGEEATRLLEEQAFDVLVADYKMPGNEDLELLQASVEANGIPTIIITGYPTMNSAIASLKREAFDYLTKPLDMEYLIRRIREAAEHHRLKLSLERMGTHYRSFTEDILEKAFFGIILLDSRFRVAWINQAVERFLNVDRKDLNDLDIRHLIAEHIKHRFEHPEGFADRILATYEKNNRTELFEARLKTAPGKPERWLEHQSQPITQGPYAGGRIEFYRDITQRKKAEQAKLRIESKLQESQKLESLGVLAGGIAHDFNNLLSGILGGASLALMDLPPDSPAVDWLHKIEESTLRAADLCRQMLAYAGKGQLSVRSLDLSRLIREMGHLLETSVSKKTALVYDFAEGLPAIEADATQLRQVVLNLITNASEAIRHESGTVTVRTGLTECNRKTLIESYLGDELPEGSYVFLEVTDTGTGMDEKTREKIFNPFFTTKFTGRGLGLSAVLGIVRSHKGTIRVTSEAGKGSTFTVFFPALAPLVPDGLDALPRKRVRHGEGVVLVIDDEEIVRNITKSLLTNAGYQVLTARDGLEGLDLIRAHVDDLSAVLLDLTMPRMSGDEVFREIRTIRSNIPVILISGYNVKDAEKRFPADSLAGFIQKPFKPGELLDKITKAIRM